MGKGCGTPEAPGGDACSRGRTLHQKLSFWCPSSSHPGQDCRAPRRSAVALRRDRASGLQRCSSRLQHRDTHRCREQLSSAWLNQPQRSLRAPSPCLPPENEAHKSLQMEPRTQHVHPGLLDLCASSSAAGKCCLRRHEPKQPLFALNLQSRVCRAGGRCLCRERSALQSCGSTQRSLGELCRSMSRNLRRSGLFWLQRGCRKLQRYDTQP